MVNPIAFAGFGMALGSMGARALLVAEDMAADERERLVEAARAEGVVVITADTVGDYDKVAMITHADDELVRGHTPNRLHWPTAGEPLALDRTHQMLATTAELLKPRQTVHDHLNWGSGRNHAHHAAAAQAKRDRKAARRLALSKTNETA